MMLFDVETQKWTALPKIVTNWPEWSRQADYIYFLGDLAGGRQGLFRVRISDLKLEQLTTLNDFHQPSDWGAWVGLAPDDSPLLLRDTGTQDIYALDVELP
jgi:hypothetical protein